MEIEIHEWVSHSLYYDVWVRPGKWFLLDHLIEEVDGYRWFGGPPTYYPTMQDAVGSRLLAWAERAREAEVREYDRDGDERDHRRSWSPEDVAEIRALRAA